MGQSQKWMIPSCCLWKVVTFFRKEHVNLFTISGVMIQSNLLPIITPLILDQLTCSLPKNITTFHEEKDGIIHSCLSPYKRGVLTLQINIFSKKMIFQLNPIITPLILDQLTCSLPKHITTFHGIQDGIIYCCLRPN